MPVPRVPAAEELLHAANKVPLELDATDLQAKVGALLVPVYLLQFNPESVDVYIPAVSDKAFIQATNFVPV